MKKTNYIYLTMSIAFIVIFFLTLLIDIEPKVIIGYSIAILFFSIIDLINTIEDRQKRIENIEDDDSENLVDEFTRILNEEMNETLNGLIITGEQINIAKQDLMKNILSGSLNIEKTNKNAIGKPTQSILKVNQKQTEFGKNIFDKLIDSFQKLKPEEKTSIVDKINFMLLLFAIILIFVIPFIPNAYINLLPVSLSKLGISITILGLSLIFLTSFIRNYYQEKIEKRWHDHYYRFFNELENIQNMMAKRDLVIQQQSKQVMKEIGEVGSLFKIGIEQVVNKHLEASNKKEA